MLSSSCRYPPLQLPLTTHDVVVTCRRCLGNCHPRTCRRWICKIRLAFRRTPATTSALVMATNRSSPRTLSKTQDETPIEVCDDAAAAANVNEDSRIGPLSAGTPPQPGHDTAGENVVDSSFFDDAPPQSVVDRSANAKHHKRLTPGTVASSMDNLVEVVSKQSRELKITQYVVTGKGDNTVGDYLARLMSTPRLEPGDKLFLFTCGIMDSPDNRDIIMALPVDYIVNWLTEKCACMPANVGRDRERGPQLFKSDGVVDLD